MHNIDNTMILNCTYLYQVIYSALYFGCVGLIAILVRYVFKIKGEWYRKILHLFFMGSIFCFLYIFDYWFTSAIALVLFLIGALSGLSILERYSFYKDLLAERSKGEVKRSLTLAFIVYIASISLVWGIFGQTYKYIILAAILAWGIGDALAALFGQNEKNRVMRYKYINSRKTVEGSIAMVLGATITIFIVLYYVGHKPLTYSLIVSLVSGLVSTITEAYTKDGWDTFTIPPVVMIILLVMEVLLISV